MVRTVFRLLPMFMVMGGIFYLSHQPGDFIRLPGGTDKLVHALAYGILATTCLYGVKPYMAGFSVYRVGVGIFIFCLLYGISDEFHQSFIPGRFASVRDVGADALGSAFVVGCWLLSKRKRAVQST